MATLEERLEATERTLVALMEAAVGAIELTHTRLLALQTVLRAKGVVNDAEVAAKMQALRDAATLEVEYGDDPSIFSGKTEGRANAFRPVCLPDTVDPRGPKASQR